MKTAAIREKDREVHDMCQDVVEIEVFNGEFDTISSKVFNSHNVQSEIIAILKQNLVKELTSWPSECSKHYIPTQRLQVQISQYTKIILCKLNDFLKNRT